MKALRRVMRRTFAANFWKFFCSAANCGNMIEFIVIYRVHFGQNERYSPSGLYSGL